ncbi:MAG: MerR family transcriptional regulator [Caldilineaceae bacterium]|nr:MerR family transcriptional regulator [Caldilineaceae bacterium]MDE0339666.1 MerR family transcriptional regulator [Caldilineaceae bacterium]
MSTKITSFNLQAVVRETGIKPETLRAWERRHGLPRPERSSGGQRIYSRRDIEALHWLKLRRLEGLSISNAARRWHTLESEGRDPLQEYALAPEQYFSGYNWSEHAPFEGEEISSDDDGISVACSEWASACKEFDEPGAQRALAQAFAQFSVEAVCIHVLCKGLREFGEEWHAGRVSTQQVSFATSQAMQRIKALLGTCPPPTRPGLVLLACPHGESHTFGLALLHLVLKRKGVGTVFLGENLLQSELETTLSRIQPDLVVLVSQQLRSAGNLLEMSELISRQDVPVAFGGRIFNLSEVIRCKVPGSFLGTDLQQAGGKAESLLETPDPRVSAAPSNNRFEDLISRYRASLFRISSMVQSTERGTPPGWAMLGRPSYSINSTMMSALQLGDPSLVSLEAEWISTFLASRKIPVSTLEEYLSLGISAVQTVLGVEGGPIVSMLETIGKDVRQCYGDN